MEDDLRGGTLDAVRVLEDHNGLGVDGLGQVLGLLTGEVLFEEVDLVVLLDAALSVVHEIAGGKGVREERVTNHLFHVLGDLGGLLGVVLLGPATDGMLHAAVLGGNALSIHL